jgi:hypothetical protein
MVVWFFCPGCRAPSHLRRFEHPKSLGELRSGLVIGLSVTLDDKGTSSMPAPLENGELNNWPQDGVEPQTRSAA